MTKPNKILVVDDDDSARYLLQLLFSPEETENAPVIIQACNGKIALELLELHPDTNIILLDLYMPEMNGFEFLQHVQENRTLSQIPICVLTGCKEDVLQSLKFGASDFITKPYNAEELKLRIANLIKINRKTFEIEQCKLNFLSTISHELRTPMNGIIGMSELLISSGLSTDQTDQVEAITESADHLLSLINDILKFVGSESPPMEIQVMPFRLSSIAETLKEMYQLAADQKEISLNFKVESAVTDHLLGSPYNLRQALQHLISNAIKFTESGRVTVTLRTEMHDEHKVKLSCSVNDTGVGIHHDKHLKIFEPFVQCDGSFTRKFGGLGIGLSLAYQQVRRMGGTIKVDSTPGAGSNFYFDVDCQPDTAIDFTQSADINTKHQHDQVNSALSLNVTPSVTMQNLSILLAEDLLMNQRVVSRLLNLLGHTVTIAHNGAEAVSLWERNRYDLIFMDIHMPVMDGLEATQKIRNSEAATNNPIPIIAMTADVMNGTEERCMLSGMNGYIAKPVVLSTLKEYIEQHFPVITD